MDSYPALLSPIDNFAFSQFTGSPTGSSPAPRGKQSSQSFQQDVPRTPLPKPSNEWHELLDGSQAGQFSFNMWDDNPFSSNRQASASASPWRPNVFRTLSDSFLDSPLSSSSFLSSASGSPSVLPSSTCSPWETCPGLAPVSPELPLLDELSLRFPGSLPGSSDDASTYAFNNLSLGSPIMLSYEVDSGVIEPFNLMNSQSHTATTIEPSHLMSNALALDLTEDTSNNAGASSDISHVLPPFGDSARSPPHSTRSSPPTETNNDAPPSPPRSVPSHTASSFDTFPPSAGFPSETSMQSRATRRKTSRIDYAEAAYDGDSDDDVEESADNNSIRFTKRRKASAESASFMFSESDEDVELGEYGTRRGKKGGKRTAIKGGAAAGAKRKCKRRHYCTIDGCKQSFTRVTDMARHAMSVHRSVDTDANRCAFCHKAFSRDDAVLRHENDSCPMRPRKKASIAELWA